MSDAVERERRRIEARDEAREIYWGINSRQEHVCQQCGSDSPLEVHHRDGDPFNNRLSNLTGLCHSCHRGEHRRQNTEARLETMEEQFDALVGDGETEFVDEEPRYTGYGSAH